jgi:hypothetical protein
MDIRSFLLKRLIHHVVDSRSSKRADANDFSIGQRIVDAVSGNRGLDALADPSMTGNVLENFFRQLLERIGELLRGLFGGDEKEEKRWTDALGDSLRDTHEEVTRRGLLRPEEISEGVSAGKTAGRQLAPAGEAQKAYVEKYAGMAMEQMRRYGIPASVTLAQGILESRSGQSGLSVQGNNHFGIKATKSWLSRGGGYLVFDDDKPNEKFCKYASAAESFEHHSRFLVDNKRYAGLFKLAPDDHSGWARGLQAAGYATAKTYASSLEGIIAQMGLDRYDRQVLREGMGQEASMSVPASIAIQGQRRDASELPDGTPMKASDLSVERKLADGTATWRDAFLYSAEGGPKDARLAERWKALMEGSREERFRAGFYTYGEAKAAVAGLDAEQAEQFRKQVRGLRACPGNRLDLDGTYPALQFLVGDGRVKSPDAGRKLSWVGGNLDVDAATTMDSLKEVRGALSVRAPFSAAELKTVKGNMEVDAPSKTRKLATVLGNLSVRASGLLCPALGMVRGRVRYSEGSVVNSEDRETKETVRRANNAGRYEALTRKLDTYSQRKSGGMQLKG